MSKQIYVVICCCDREIYSLGETKDRNEAYEIMKEDFMDSFLDRYEESDFEKDENRNEEWNLTETDAWLDRGNTNLDWRILSVEVE